MQALIILVLLLRDQDFSVEDARMRLFLICALCEDLG